jgi:hypothetical protein
MRSILVRAVLWAVLVSAALATLARADYQSAYKKGLDAVQRHAWADAAREMRVAIGEQPTEGEQIKLYGMRFETYLPHYYLGLAHFSAGDCSQALRAWSDSEGQGAVKRRPEYKDLRRDRATCETRLAAVRPAPTPALVAPTPSVAETPRVLPAAARAAGSAMKPAVPAELVAGTSAYLRAQYHEAVETLSRAHSDDSRTNAHVLLLRSAARFALYSLSEERDDALKQAALVDARDCRRLDPRAIPSPRVFSPRFLAFFASQP